MPEVEDFVSQFFLTQKRTWDLKVIGNVRRGRERERERTGTLSGFAAILCNLLSYLKLG